MTGDRTAYERSVLSEVRMLLDFVAGNGAINLSALTAPDVGTPGKQLGPQEILVRLDGIEKSLRDPRGRPLGDGDFALLQLVRDAVSRMARPATGLTVAFTALVVGRRRSNHAESRATLAEEAYPALVQNARWMRGTQIVLTLLALGFTLIAIWVASEVALGKAVLNNLDTLRAQQTGLTAEKLRLEQALDKQPTDPALTLFASPPGAASKRIATKAFSLCDRPEAIADYITHFSPAVRIPEHAKAPDNPAEAPPDKLKIYASPEERDVCQRDGLLATSFRIVHNELQEFRDHWPSMIGGVFNAPSEIFSAPSKIAGLFGGLWNQAQAKQQISGKPQAEASSPPPAPTAKAASNEDNEDVEFIIAPLLLVLGNYVLPIIFGFLGALMFVILDLYGKLKESRLDPRDNALSWLRLVLGLATGACIGLFMSSYAPPASPAAAAAASGTASGLASSLTLSASGLAFLAGFGVEGVFRMLQALVGRVFASDTREPART